MWEYIFYLNSWVSLINMFFEVILELWEIVKILCDWFNNK